MRVVTDDVRRHLTWRLVAVVAAVSLIAGIALERVWPGRFGVDWAAWSVAVSLFFAYFALRWGSGLLSVHRPFRGRPVAVATVMAAVALLAAIAVIDLVAVRVFGAEFDPSSAATFAIGLTTLAYADFLRARERGEMRG